MIAVTDTGHGIPADIRDRVFEPFFTTKGIGRGTGLGLSMVYGFAKQSGGSVEIDSQEGRGTTVTLYLPRSTGQSETIAEPVQSTGTPRGHETILVVEDDALVRGYVIAQLGGLGYRTLVASDGVGGACARRPGRRIRPVVHRHDHAGRDERPANWRRPFASAVPGSRCSTRQAIPTTPSCTKAILMPASRCSASRTGNRIWRRKSARCWGAPEGRGPRQGDAVQKKRGGIAPAAPQLLNSLVQG